METNVSYRCKRFITFFFKNKSYLREQKIFIPLKIRFIK